MQIFYTTTFRGDVKSQIDFFKEEDAWHGTELVSDLHVAIQDAEKYILTFPNGFGTGEIRQITLPKFKNHYITFRVNKSHNRIELLKLRSFKEKRT